MMKVNSVKCEAIDVKTETRTCIGIAKTQKGEEYIIDERIPKLNGMCSNAFCALGNAVFIMIATQKMPGEKDGYIDRICPHRIVTFRLSRSKIDKKNAYNKKYFFLSNI